MEKKNFVDIIESNKRRLEMIEIDKWITETLSKACEDEISKCQTKTIKEEEQKSIE